jgi:Arc/MetJ-type ribon-helix-helix transcriptional regulator
MCINSAQNLLTARRSQSISVTLTSAKSISWWQEGFYSNRTDFIRSAIRNQLERHADVVRQSTVRKRLDLGLRHYSREDLEAARRSGEMLEIHVLGLASIALDVTPELARATIASVSVLGSFHASPAVKDVLADRMR